MFIVLDNAFNDYDYEDHAEATFTVGIAETMEDCFKLANSFVDEMRVYHEAHRKDNDWYNDDIPVEIKNVEGEFELSEGEILIKYVTCNYPHPNVGIHCKCTGHIIYAVECDCNKVLPYYRKGPTNHGRYW